MVDFSQLVSIEDQEQRKKKCRYYTFLQQRHLCLTNIFCLHATLFILEYITHHAIHYFLSIYFTYISDRQQEILSEKNVDFFILLRYIIEKGSSFLPLVYHVFLSGVLASFFVFNHYFSVTSAWSAASLLSVRNLGLSLSSILIFDLSLEYLIKLITSRRLVWNFSRSSSVRVAGWIR